jgi:hypothetical protein
VTIATNTAGRGTDIIMEQESLNNGGLHVLLTFFPSSEREEQQAIGRAGRQGQPGSSQMVLNTESPSIYKIIAPVPVQQMLLSYPGDLCRQLLNLKRSNRELAYAPLHLKRANLERYFSEQTHLFFDAFRIWVNHVNHGNFLNMQSQYLCKIKLNARKKRELDFNHLEAQELALAEECKRLLTQEVDWLSWKVFLKEVIEKIKQKVIINWSLDFFQPTEKKIKDISNEENSMKTEISLNFNNYRKEWEGYLKTDGSGILLYLQELTNITLKFKSEPSVIQIETTGTKGE